MQRLSDYNSGWEAERSDASTWNVDAFVEAVNNIEMPKVVDWGEVMHCLDHPDFQLHDVHGLRMIVRAYKQGSKGNTAFPVASILRAWKNTAGQVN